MLYLIKEAKTAYLFWMYSSMALAACLAGTHGLDDGGGAGHGVAAGVHALTAGLALVAAR